MKNQVNLALKIKNFEHISENSESKLIGGFSTSISMSSTDENNLEIISNNCHGGNCTTGCGGWPTNDYCNSVSGCGEIQK